MHGGGCIIVWDGTFAYCKVGYLHQVKGKLNQTCYHSILQHHTIPSGTRFVGQGFVLMQDNNPEHTSKLCQVYIKSKNEQYIFLLIWLAQPADLNPIELVWDELDWKVGAKQLTNVANLWQFLQEIWVELSSVYLQSLVEWMPRIWNGDSSQMRSFWWMKNVCFWRGGGLICI